VSDRRRARLWKFQLLQPSKDGSSSARCRRSSGAARVPPDLPGNGRQNYFGARCLRAATSACCPRSTRRTAAPLLSGSRSRRRRRRRQAVATAPSPRGRGDAGRGVPAEKVSRRSRLRPERRDDGRRLEAAGQGREARRAVASTEIRLQAAPRRQARQAQAVTRAVRREEGVEGDRARPRRPRAQGEPRRGRRAAPAPEDRANAPAPAKKRGRRRTPGRYSSASRRTRTR